MTAYLLDSSSLVKLYVAERGSTWVRGVVASGAHEITVAEVTLVEVTSALFRRVCAGSLDQRDARLAASDLLRKAAADFDRFPLSSTVLHRAIDAAERHALRGYDCVQLGTALAIEDRRRAAGLDSLVLVSADGDLNAAASVEGLPVEDANAR